MSLPSLSPESHDGVPGGYARTKARTLDRAFRKQNRKLLRQGAGVMALGTAVIWCLHTLADMPWAGFSAGVYIGAIGMAFFHELRQLSGSAAIHRGAEAEELVDEMLREAVPNGWQVRGNPPGSFELLRNVATS